MNYQKQTKMTISEVYTKKGEFYHTFGTPETAKWKAENIHGHKVEWVKECKSTFKQIKEYNLPFIY